MMVRLQTSVITRRISIQLEFPNQSCLRQRVQRVVNGGSGSLCMAPVQRRPKLVHRCMIRMSNEIIEHGKSLRSAPQAGCPDGLFNFVGFQI